MGNLKELLFGKKASLKKGESEPGDEPLALTQEDVELKRGTEFLDDPNLHLQGVRPENVKPYSREDWLEQYSIKQDVEEQKAERKAEEDKELQEGLDNRRISTRAVSQEQLTIAMGGIPAKGIVRKVEHPKEDVREEQ